MTDPYVCHDHGVTFTINIPPVLLAYIYISYIYIYHTYGSVMGWKILWKIPPQLSHSAPPLKRRRRQTAIVMVQVFQPVMNRKTQEKTMEKTTCSYATRQRRFARYKQKSTRREKRTSRYSVDARREESLAWHDPGDGSLAMINDKNRGGRSIMAVRSYPPPTPP